MKGGKEPSPRGAPCREQTEQPLCKMVVVIIVVVVVVVVECYCYLKNNYC